MVNCYPDQSVLLERKRDIWNVLKRHASRRTYIHTQMRGMTGRYSPLSVDR